MLKHWNLWLLPYQLALQTRSQPFKECFKLTTCKPQGWKTLRTHNCEHLQPSQLWPKTVHAVLLKRDLKAVQFKIKDFNKKKKIGICTISPPIHVSTIQLTFPLEKKMQQKTRHHVSLPQLIFTSTAATAQDQQRYPEPVYTENKFFTPRKWLSTTTGQLVYI